MIAGPVLAGLGVWLLRDPEGWTGLSHWGNRLLYRLVGARYERSRLERLTSASARLAGLVGVILGIGWFVTGLVLLICG